MARQDKVQFTYRNPMLMLRDKLYFFVIDIRMVNRFRANPDCNRC